MIVKNRFYIFPKQMVAVKFYKQTCGVLLSSSLNIEFDISFERVSELCDDYLPLSHSSPSDEMWGSGSTKNVMIRETFCNTRTLSRHKFGRTEAHSAPF